MKGKTEHFLKNSCLLCAFFAFGVLAEQDLFDEFDTERLRSFSIPSFHNGKYFGQKAQQQGPTVLVPTMRITMGAYILVPNTGIKLAIIRGQFRPSTIHGFHLFLSGHVLMKVGTVQAESLSCPP